MSNRVSTIVNVDPSWSQVPGTVLSEVLDRVLAASELVTIPNSLGLEVRTSKYAPMDGYFVRGGPGQYWQWIPTNGPAPFGSPK